ncbi:uncharacterized protein A4U43_C07F39080 [Asparagus officinalis]|uniref:Uncharacterized protein n=1 Tax=Asparagus officinalis TaxID=4686 RepID=A0A5P1EIR4_ASPOF|nr:uncharacterized protein A4U43_C07F39080 [Asparagus officinalis]
MVARASRVRVLGDRITSMMVAFGASVFCESELSSTRDMLSGRFRPFLCAIDRMISSALRGLLRMRYQRGDSDTKGRAKMRKRNVGMDIEM